MQTIRFPFTRYPIFICEVIRQAGISIPTPAMDWRTSLFVSAIRNKQIATLFKEAGIIEKYGSGIKRVLESIRSYGLKDPSFEEIQDGFG